MLIKAASEELASFVSGCGWGKLKAFWTKGS
jgi:hypothetical protein